VVVSEMKHALSIRTVYKLPLSYIISYIYSVYAATNCNVAVVLELQQLVYM